MQRRNFMNWVGVGFFASSLPVVLAACQGGSETVNSTDTTDTADAGDASASAADMASDEAAPREDGFSAIGSLTDLDDAGSIVDETLAVAVIRNPSDTEVLLAVSSECPHQGCTVEWDGEDGEFFCPCHASSFAPAGSVTSGPAKEALAQFEAKIEDEMVFVKTS